MTNIPNRTQSKADEEGTPVHVDKDGNYTSNPGPYFKAVKVYEPKSVSK